LAHGPEEKRGLSGRVAGFKIAIFATLSDIRPSLGKGVPLEMISFSNTASNIGFKFIFRKMKHPEAIFIRSETFV
jgi:hypothetical protein